MERCSLIKNEKQRDCHFKIFIQFLLSNIDFLLLGTELTSVLYDFFANPFASRFLRKLYFKTPFKWNYIVSLLYRWNNNCLIIAFLRFSDNPCSPMLVEQNICMYEFFLVYSRNNL